MEKFLQILVCAVLVEAIWENIKMVWQDGKISIDRIGSLVISIPVCVLTGIDIFAAVNIPISIAYIGSVLTGIIVSRGANFVHDLLEKINSFSNFDKINK